MSLAADDPDRWAAIVPVSQGGDPVSAARLTRVPCWCFHADADDVIGLRQDIVRRHGWKDLPVE